MNNAGSMSLAECFCDLSTVVMDDHQKTNAAAHKFLSI